MTRSPADRSHLSIGEVLSLLQDEFPDVTISKIRFLESQGLLDPERTPSGYRKFYDDDIERLRWILRQQKENYLPLKVIKDRLDDRAAQAAAAAAAEAEESAAATPPAGRNGGGGRHGGRSSRNGAGRGGRTGAPGGPSTASGPPRTSVNGRGRSAVAVDERPDAAGAAGGGSAGTDAARAAGPGAAGAPGKGASAAARVTTGEAYAREGASAPGSGGPGGPGPVARDAAADGTGQPAVADDSASEGRSPATAAPRPSGPSGPADAPGATPAARPPAGVDASRTIDIPHEGVRVDASHTGASGGRADLPAGLPGRPSRLEPTPAAAPTGADTTGPVVPAGGATTGSSQAPVLAGYPDLARYAGLGHEASTSISLTIDELAEASGMTARDLHELEGFGLLESHVVGDAAYYDGDALVVARTAAGFLRHGIEARHLRTYKVAIDREAGLFEQIVLPLLKQRNPEAHRRANRIVAELIHLGEAMRGTLLHRELRDHIDP